MRDKKKIFNIIEIIILKNKSGLGEIIHLGLKRKENIEILICEKKKFVENFKKLLTKLKLKKVNIFCFDPAILLSLLINSNLKKNSIKLKTRAVKLEIYEFEFDINKTSIRIQNLNKITSEGIIKEICPEFEFKPIINYWSDSFELKYTLPEWANE
jgi:hypothetical protein